MRTWRGGGVLVLVCSSLIAVAHATDPPAPPAISGEVADLLKEASARMDAGKAEEALALAERAQGAARNAGDAGGEGAACSSRARALAALQRDAEALRAWGEAAAAWDRAGDGPGRIEAIAGEALALLKLGRGEESRAALESVIGVAERESLRPIAAADALDRLGSALWTRRHLVEASILYDALIRIRESQPAAAQPLADALGRRALLEIHSNDYDAADALLQRALRIARDAGPGTLAEATVLEGIGELHLRRDEAPAAREEFQKSLEIVERLAQGSTRHAQVLCDLGRAASAMSEFDAGDESYQRALALFERSGEDPVGMGITLTGLGKNAARRGSLVEARAYQERALAIEEQVAPESRETIETIFNLAWLLMQVSESRKAVGILRRAIEIEERKDPESLEVARLLGRLGWVQRDWGDRAGARESLQRARSIYEKRAPTSTPLGEVLAQLVRLQIGDGDISEIDSMLRQGESIASGYQLAHVLFYRGMFEIRRRDLAASRSAFERTLALLEETGGGVNTHGVRGWLSWLDGAEGVSRRAIERALQVDADSDEFWAAFLARASEREALIRWRDRFSFLSVAMTLLSDPTVGDDASRRAMADPLVRARASVLEEMSRRRHEAAQATDPETVRLRLEVNEARKRLAAVAVGGRGGRTEEAFRAELYAARQAKDAAERALALKLPASGRGEAVRKAGFAEVQAALPARSALVAFVRYPHHPFTFEARDGVPSYGALVILPGGAAPAFVPLGPSERVETLVRALRQRIVQESLAAARSPRRGEEAYREAGADLRRVVWDPVAAYLAGADQVFVVPDGLLNLVDLAALPAGEGGYLIESGPAIRYLSAERDLLNADHGPTGTGVLALGAPAFDRTPPAGASAPSTPRSALPSCDTFRSMRFEPLPESAGEARAVAREWPKEGVGTGPVTVLEGTAATEAAFKREAPGRRVVHLATHGFYLGESCTSVPEACFDASCGNERDSINSGVDVYPDDNPLVLSGVILAGANRRDAAAQGEEDGILTAEEISTLDLEGLELAVLSACNTGVGEAQSAEGVLGLRRAFEAAGARSVMLALWPVEDRMTRRWMSTFYHLRFGHGQQTAEAARGASLEILKERRASGATTHPFYWAGFVATGG